jgi:putative ABC transport system permease protein
MATLRKVLSRRAYAALATLTLTLAVGANLVVFSVVKAIWLRPDPVSHADRLVMVLGDDSNSGPSDSFFFADLGLESQLRSSGLFAGVAGQVATTGYESSFTPHVVLADVGHEVETTGVTFQYFSVLGVTIRGRDFTRDDDRYGAEAVGIISDRLWRNVFGARANVIGALMPGARLGEHTDLWIPANQVPRVAPVGESRIRENEVSLLALARLREGLSVSQADRLLTEHVAAAALKSPARLRVVSLRQIFGAPDSRTIIIREETVLRVVTASAALVLVHYERRRHELSVRLALGATRARLAKQLAAELGWLTVPGVVGASLFASWSLRALPSLNLPGGVDLSRL